MPNPGARVSPHPHPGLRSAPPRAIHVGPGGAAQPAMPNPGARAFPRARPPDTRLSPRTYTRGRAPLHPGLSTSAPAGPFNRPCQIPGNAGFRAHGPRVTLRSTPGAVQNPCQRHGRGQPGVERSATPGNAATHRPRPNGADGGGAAKWTLFIRCGILCVLLSVVPPYGLKTPCHYDFRF